MKRCYPWAVGLVLLVTGLLSGCEAPIPSTPPAVAPADSIADAWGRWCAIADSDQANWDVAEAARLTEILAQHPGGLNLMLARVADPDQEASVRVLVIMSVTPYRSLLSPYESTIDALTAPSHGAGVRAVGAHLLGLVPTESAADRVVLLLEDTDRTVREAAMGVLTSFHSERIADRLVPFWEDPETTTQIREQLILGMAPGLVAQHLGLFAEVVTNETMNPAVRYKAATVLGQLGGAAHQAALAHCASSDPDPHVKERAQGGLALLEARLQPGNEASGHRPDAG